MNMKFDLWLFSIKRLGYNPENARTIFAELSIDEQNRIKEEYETSRWSNHSDLAKQDKGAGENVAPKKNKQTMPLDLWLYTIKHLGTTMDSARLVYDNMPENEKAEIMREYEEG